MVGVMAATLEALAVMSVVAMLLVVEDVMAAVLAALEVVVVLRS